MIAFEKTFLFLTDHIHDWVLINVRDNFIYFIVMLAHQTHYFRNGKWLSSDSWRISCKIHLKQITKKLTKNHKENSIFHIHIYYSPQFLIAVWLIFRTPAAMPDFNTLPYPYYTKHNIHCHCFWHDRRLLLLLDDLFLMKFFSRHRSEPAAAVVLNF